MVFLRLAGYLMCAIIFSGCSLFETIREGRSQYEMGWREGRVSDVGSAYALDVPKYIVNDCRSSSENDRAQTFALIEHHRHTAAYWSVVPVPKDMIIKSGDLVHVNIERCEDAIKSLDSGAR